MAKFMDLMKTRRGDSLHLTIEGNAMKYITAIVLCLLCSASIMAGEPPKAASAKAFLVDFAKMREIAMAILEYSADRGDRVKGLGKLVEDGYLREDILKSLGAKEIGIQGDGFIYVDEAVVAAAIKEGKRPSDIVIVRMAAEIQYVNGKSIVGNMDGSVGLLPVQEGQPGQAP